jgi:chromosome segregation ATPase
MQIHSDVDDEKIVCKFGRTDNLEQRIANHKSEFKFIRGTQLQLRKIAAIDPFHSSKAETDLKHYVNKFKLEFEQKEELIVVDKKELSEVEERMYFLSLRYGGSKQEIAGLLDKANQEIDRLNREMDYKTKELVHINKEIAHMNKEMDYKNNELRIQEEKYQAKILNKELEVKLAQQELKYFKLKMGIQE